MARKDNLLQMMTNWIVTADLHLDDKPQHEYRWGIFDWLANQQKKHNASGCLILGDVTDEKDCHSSSLVNRMVAGLTKLRPPVYILKGNHDYIRQDNPFFGFLGYIDGLSFISEPTALDSGIFAIPHQPNQSGFDAACEGIEPLSKLVLLHGCFEGALAETGQRLTGLRASLIEKKQPRLVLAGDIHKPQLVGGLINYVGAPYRVRFGDDFEPRALFVDTNLGSCHSLDLRFAFPMKHSFTIRTADELYKLGTRKGDQVKITIKLAREEVTEWSKYKKNAMDVCRELGLEVFGVKLLLPEAQQPKNRGNVNVSTPSKVFEGFCTAEDIRGPIKKAGLSFLEDNNECREG